MKRRARKLFRLLDPRDHDVDGHFHAKRTPTLDDYDEADEDLVMAGMMFATFYDDVDPFVLRKCRDANRRDSKRGKST